MKSVLYSPAYAFLKDMAIKVAHVSCETLTHFEIIHGKVNTPSGLGKDLFEKQE